MKFRHGSMLLVLVFSISTPLLGAGEIEALINSCESCHGPQGTSQTPSVPTIGGLPYEYMVESLVTFKDGQRPCPDVSLWEGLDEVPMISMCEVAMDMNDLGIEAVSKYFSGQSFVPAEQDFDPALAVVGKKIHDANCEQCHKDGGSFPDNDAGVLAGQWSDYLGFVMEDFREGARPMPDEMARQFELLSPKEITSLLHFYASQQ